MSQPKPRTTRRSEPAAPEDHPRINDAKRVVPREAHVENVGQRRPDAESDDQPITRHPDDRENERDVERALQRDVEHDVEHALQSDVEHDVEGDVEAKPDRDSDVEGYATERSGAV